MKIQYMSDLHLEFSDNSRWMKHNELPASGNDICRKDSHDYIPKNLF